MPFPNSRITYQQKFKQFHLGQSSFPHQTNTYHTIRYYVTCTEKPRIKPHQLLSEISLANLAEKVILKTGKLTLSSKTNTRL